MRGRKPKKVILQFEQIQVLQRHLNTEKTEQRVLRRARILLLSCEGKYPGEIAGYVDCDPATVWRTCERFRERGLGVLLDLPRPGAPRRIFSPPEGANSGFGLSAARSKRQGAHALVCT